MSTNVKSEVKGDTLIITIKTDKNSVEQAPWSKSGKNKLLATTNGFTGIPGSNVRISINAIV